MEKKWIKYLDSYKNGYNSTPGGEGFVAGADHPCAVKIKCVSLLNKHEYQFDCYKDAELYIGVSAKNISHVLSNGSSNIIAYNLV
jgi:hypothetical protein